MLEINLKNLLIIIMLNVEPCLLWSVKNGMSTSNFMYNMSSSCGPGLWMWSNFTHYDFDLHRLGSRSNCGNPF